MKKRETDNLFKKRINRRKFLKYGIASASGVLLSPLIKISPVGATGVVRIGFPTGYTGFAGVWMRHCKMAADLIVEEYNAAGGIKSLGGAKIEVLYADTKSDLSVHKSEVEKMINVNKAMLFFSGPSALSMVGSAVAEKYGAPMVCLATADALTERGLKYYFRIAIKASDNAKCATGFAWHMYQNMGKKFKNVGVIHSDDAFGAAAGRTMDAEAKKHSEWNFVDRIAYSPAKL